MSGGYLNPQKKKQHQVIIFTFTGDISAADKRAWNEAILALKKRFGAKLTGITLKGDDTPGNLS